VTRTGVILNPWSRRNRRAEARREALPGVLTAAPHTPEALDEALAAFAAARLDLLAIDGGDGTVREVLTRAIAHFGSSPPPIAVLPSGKTNALALDLGAPLHWTLDEALESCRAGRITRRAPLEVTRAGEAEPFVRGFILGAGAYVHATDLAQRAHRLGAFNSFAVAITIAAAAVRTLGGGARSPWRHGAYMGLDGAEPRPIFVLAASSLKRLPLGLKPFGPPSAELRTLVIDAPPRRLLRALPYVLAGRDAEWLGKAGYHRNVVEGFDLVLDGRFVLDGEAFPAGHLRISRGPELDFVKP
jgi:diacylglycerol kinase (ATP)